MQGDDLEFERLAQDVERRWAETADDDALLCALFGPNVELHDGQVCDVPCVRRARAMRGERKLGAAGLESAARRR